MGGKGSGGNRVGAGRPRKDNKAGDLSGSRRTRARAKKSGNQTGNQTSGNQTETPQEAASVVEVAVQVPQPPGSLTLDELAEWNDLAPRAFKLGTLTDETALGLRDLCQLRVLKDRILRRVTDQGDTVWGAGGTMAAHPLLTRITTLSQRVEAGMARYKLLAMGKEIEVAGKKEADPFAEFDDQPDSEGATKH
jgi:hypothetical protein